MKLHRVQLNILVSNFYKTRFCFQVDGTEPSELLNVQDLDVRFLKDDQQESLLTASILQQFHNTSIPFIRAATVGSPVSSLNARL